MMRYDGGRYQRSGLQAAARPRSRFDGYRFSLMAPPVLLAGAGRTAATEPHSFRTVTPSLRPLVQRHNGRCPECTGPLVSGEASVACPVCGFRRRG